MSEDDKVFKEGVVLIKGPFAPNHSLAVEIAKSAQRPIKETVEHLHAKLAGGLGERIERLKSVSMHKAYIVDPNNNFLKGGKIYRASEDYKAIVEMMRDLARRGSGNLLASEEYNSEGKHFETRFAYAQAAEEKVFAELLLNRDKIGAQDVMSSANIFVRATLGPTLERIVGRLKRVDSIFLPDESQFYYCDLSMVDGKLRID
ncbi:MAG TPA: hypothetical protein VFE88_00195 [Candidatus Nanoarchaeia archaeon]|nr:hypothetical protein [Candidatus Nanoarchaeia archaeon]